MKRLEWMLAVLATVLTLGCERQQIVIQTPTPVSPVTTPASTTDNASLERTGTFVAAEHETSGTVRIVNQEGQVALELDQDFQTNSGGPDLFVVLHRAADVLSVTEPPSYSLQEADYVLVAPLSKFEGAQVYPIPESIQLSDYGSVAIWCRQFNATFGAATLR